MARSLMARSRTTRTTAGSGRLSSLFTARRSMAATFELRANRLPGRVRRAHGEAGSMVYRARRKIMQETIYQRPQVYPAPPTRILTGNLYRSERIVMAGNVIRLTNLAPYAHLRHEMRGISKMYGHRLDSFWAGRAMQFTASARSAVYRRALAEVWALQA